MNDIFWRFAGRARPQMRSCHVVISNGIKLQPMKQIGDLPWRVEPFRHSLTSRNATIRSYHNCLKCMSVVGQQRMPIDETGRHPIDRVRTNTSPYPASVRKTQVQLPSWFEHAVGFLEQINIGPSSREMSKQISQQHGLIKVPASKRRGAWIAANECHADTTFFCPLRSLFDKPSTASRPVTQLKLRRASAIARVPSPHPRSRICEMPLPPR